MADEVSGTFQCPICGVDQPHHHDAITVSLYRENSRLSAELEGAREAATTDLPSVEKIAAIIAKRVFHGLPSEVELQAATQIHALFQAALALSPNPAPTGRGE